MPKTPTSTIHPAETFQPQQNTPSSYGARIEEALFLKRKSKQWLAETIGISKQALNYILRHASKPSMAVKIADALEISLEWIETGKGSIAPDSKSSYLEIPVYQVDMFEKRGHEKPIDIAVSSLIGKNLIGIFIPDNSLAPVFLAGTILIFDKDKKEKPGDYVLFKNLSLNITKVGKIFDGGDSIIMEVLRKTEKYKKSEIHTYGALVEARTKFT